MPDVSREAGKGRSQVQSLVLSKDTFKTVAAARKWVKDHDFKTDGLDETKDSYRFRQVNPGGFARFRVKQLAPGVQAVIGFKG
jgi:hypothetical protein